MKYDNVINELFNIFPFLKSEYEKEGEYIEGLPHLCFPIIFVPYIRQACSEEDEEEMQRICIFMERMAISDAEDERVSELLAVSVLESILSEREIVSFLRPYLGLYTLKILSIMDKEYGWI